MDWSDCFAKKADGTELPGQILTLSCLPNLFSGLVGWAISFAGVVALFFIMYGGLKLILSQGDKTAVEEGKKTITYAIIGLVLILMSFFIINIIAYMTGVECIKTFGFDVCSGGTSNPGRFGR